MVHPIEQLTIEASIWGNQLTLSWTKPSILPENYKLYVFKRSKIDITEQEIADYFANINDLTNYNFNGLYVFEKIDNDITGIIDNEVLNEIRYYYRVVIRDLDTLELSSSVGVDGVTQIEIKVNTADCKEITEKALNKFFDSLKSTKGDKLYSGRDLKIIKNFSIEPIAPNLIMIERINGANYIQFLGQQITGTPEWINGEIENDVIRVTFLTTEGNNRRDHVANIFRAYKQLLRQLLIKAGQGKVINVVITLEGDYYNPQIHGIAALGTTLIINFVIESKTLLPKEKINEIIANFTIEE
ncbi:MAG TPA: hypothetical protein P5215_05565 [Bacteroidales bacterium]|nr:hypothetical protein [Bacteroidales bacterium]